MIEPEMPCFPRRGGLLKRRGGAIGPAMAGCLAALMLGTAAARAAEGAVPGVPAESKEQRDRRMAWWREAKFGMFIHWGLYSVAGGVWNGRELVSSGEWIMFRAKVPVADYEPLASQFNPVKFDAREWVRIAKDAGCKYITITTKHHDGFCLFDSKLTDYNVMHTPFKRDIMKELADECHRQGVQICWYYSVLDWHHPDYLPRGPGSARPWDTRPTEGAVFERYVDYMKGQLRELVSNYGRIGVIWFDGAEYPPEKLHAEEILAMMRSFQPGIIINDRINLPGDFTTPEQSIPDTGIPGRDWETCATIASSWGYKPKERNWKSAPRLIRDLVDIASKGGNFLLNVGPSPEGLIPSQGVERLAAMGQWLKVNGEALYGTTASPFRHLGWGRCTVKPGVIYLHVFDWPADGTLVVGGLKSPGRRAYLLADAAHAPLAVTNRPEGLAITVPAKAPDPIASVIALEVDGPPSVEPVPVPQLADGSVTLGAGDATIHGDTAKLGALNGRENIGSWTNPKDWVSWEFVVTQPGTFNVVLNYACDPARAGAGVAVECGDQKVEATVSPTQNGSRYRAVVVGDIKIAAAGKTTLAVKPTSAPHGEVMNLKSVVLRPGM